MPARYFHELTITQFLAPVALALFRFQSCPLQSHEVAEPGHGRCELGRSRFTAHERSVVKKDFCEQRSHAPAIKNSVMKTERELKRVLGAKVNMHPNQWRLNPIKVSAFFRLLPRRQ